MAWAQLNDLEAPTLDSLDELLVEHLEDLFFEGSHHSDCDKLLAAVVFTSPRIHASGKSCLPRAFRSARGFARLAPGMNRAPLPWLGLLAMIGAALAVGNTLLAWGMLVQFVAYHRPGELLGAQKGHLIAPRRGSGTPQWALLLAPQEKLKHQKLHNSTRASC